MRLQFNRGAMLLSEYINKSRLDDHIRKGFVSISHHPTLPLAVYNYTRKAMYDYLWNDVTRYTRGLIVNTETDEIIARPFEKFFDYNSHPSTHPLTVRDYLANFGEPLITEKINGSLGIFWRHGIHWGIATKGSFKSDHAFWATKWLEDHVEQNGRLLFPDGYTPVFEIICQGVQEHPIKYNEDKLVLLSFVNIETGEELTREVSEMYALRNKLDITKKYDITLAEALNINTDEFEGFVATFCSTPPLKIKIKFPKYLEKRKIFYAEQEKKKQEALAATMEPEYESVRAKAADIVLEAYRTCTTKKEFAKYFNREENKYYASVCFAMLDDSKKNAHQEAIKKLICKT
jgi:RNA ligase